MPIKLQQSNGARIVEVKVRGKLTHQDYVEFLPALEHAIAAQGKIRVLFDMVDFHGWEMAAAWDDLKIGIRHGSDIERLAMVGDKKWEHLLAVVCRPFTRAQVRYFGRESADDARRWLTASDP